MTPRHAMNSYKPEEQVWRWCYLPETKVKKQTLVEKIYTIIITYVLIIVQSACFLFLQIQANYSRLGIIQFDIRPLCFEHFSNSAVTTHVHIIIIISNNQ